MKRISLILMLTVSFFGLRGAAVEGNVCFAYPAASTAITFMACYKFNEFAQSKLPTENPLYRAGIAAAFVGGAAGLSYTAGKAMRNTEAVALDPEDLQSRLWAHRGYDIATTAALTGAAVGNVVGGDVHAPFSMAAGCGAGAATTLTLSGLYLWKNWLKNKAREDLTVSAARILEQGGRQSVSAGNYVNTFNGLIGVGTYSQQRVARSGRLSDLEAGARVSLVDSFFRSQAGWICAEKAAILAAAMLLSSGIGMYIFYPSVKNVLCQNISNKWSNALEAAKYARNVLCQNVSIKWNNALEAVFGLSGPLVPMPSSIS